MSARDTGNSISLRRSLFLRFAGLATGCAALLAFGYVLLGLQPIAERIARSHFNTAVEKVDGALSHLFNPVVAMLGISRDWATQPGFDINRPADFNHIYQPVLRQYPHMTSVVAGDAQGRGWLLLELPGNRWRNRLTDVQQRGKLQHFIDWTEGGQEVRHDEIIDYDARKRPWYTSAAAAPANGQVHWTEPYTFFTTKDPGITGSTRVDLTGGNVFVIGIDIKLIDISRITANLKIGSRGYMMVITGDGRLLGMPHNQHGTSDDNIRSLVFKPVEALNMPSASNALNQWRLGQTKTTAELRYTSGGEEWFAAFRPFVLGEQTFWVAAIAPAADFVPSWPTMLLTLFGIMLTVLLLSLVMAHLFSAPLEALVASSERISHLDFSAAERVPTPLVELQRLALAQERMREVLGDFRNTVDAQAADLKQQIAALRATEARLAHLSQHDPLTDLPNRVLFNDRLKHAITRAHRSKHLFAVMFLDLDNFKALNDTRGHEAGDRLLVEVGRRLQGCVREEDSVARLGGDEFIVLVEDLSAALRDAAAQAEMLAEKMRAAIAMPFVIDGYEHHTTGSIGVTLYHGEDETGDSLLRSADGAMYRAKRSGRNTVQFFDPAMQQELDATAQLAIDLRHALPQNQLQLHFHGQFDRNLRIIGAEVLLRWKHPTRGMVSPAEFIPLAEESGLILPIGQWVLEAACAQVKAWSQAPMTRDLHLAVNVSARQFRHPSFVDDVKHALNSSGIDGRHITLELTEGVVLDDVVDSIAKMHALKALGIGLSMDDFGTGYSSLSYLSRLPLDEVKIDQSFVRNLGSIASDAAIVHAIVGMARSLKLQVIAEGVETREQFEWLVNEGCDGYQGYLFSRPAAVLGFEQVVLRSDNPPAGAAST